MNGSTITKSNTKPGITGKNNYIAYISFILNDKQMHECSQGAAINNLDKTTKYLMERFDKIEDKIDGLITTVNEIKIDMGKNYLSKEEAEKSYSPKWVSYVAIGLVSTIGLWVLNAILDLIKIK